MVIVAVYRWLFNGRRCFNAHRGNVMANTLTAFIGKIMVKTVTLKDGSHCVQVVHGETGETATFQVENEVIQEMRFNALVKILEMEYKR